MGVDAHAYISRNWSIRDIQTWIRENFGMETTIKFHDFAPQYYIIKGSDLYFHLHTDLWTPFGRQMLITTSANDAQSEVLRQLTKHFGGLWQPKDTSNTVELFEGEYWGEDGIAFFSREFIASGGKNKDIKGFGEFVKAWKEKYH